MIRFIVNPLVGLGVFLILLLIFRQLCFIIAKYKGKKLDDNKFFKGLDGDAICYCLFLIIYFVIVGVGAYYLLLITGDFILKFL